MLLLSNFYDILIFVKNQLQKRLVYGMFKLLRFMKGYRKESILGPFFKMLEVVFELMVPLIVANIVDIGIKGDNTSYIFKMSLLLVLFGLIGLTSTLAAQYFAAKAAGETVNVILLSKDVAATEISKNAATTVTNGATVFGCKVYTPSAFAKLLG